MNAHSRLVVAAAILVAASAFVTPGARAQMRMPAGAPARQTGAPRSSAVVRARPAGAHVAAAHTAAPAPRRGSAAAHAAVHFNSAANSFQADDGSFVSLQDLLNPVPGLGFDYHDLSVFNQDLLVKAAIDPVTQLKIAEARRLLRGTSFAGPGLFLWDGGAYYPISDESAAPPAPADQNSPQQEQSQQQPQQLVVVQAPNNQPATAASEEELPDVGQFVLVLRNGGKLQAVAFTRMNDRIVYITTDGSKRSIAFADLNPEATIKLNEERGTPLQLPL